MKKIFFITFVILIAFLTAFLQPLNAAAVSPFLDVDDSEIYKKGIEFLSSLKIINGYPDQTYKPQKTLNRAEMIKIIAEGAAIYYNWPKSEFDSYAQQKCFPDIEQNQWYVKYVCYGKAKGWIQGYEDNTYKPEQTVSFVEGLKITFQVFNIKYDAYSDPWYRDLVDRASENNYIPYDIYEFTNGLKRNQIADMITRIIKKAEGKLAEYLADKADLIVTYDTIEAGQDISKLEKEVLCVGACEN